MIKGVEMQKNIIETVKDAGTFTTLVAAIDRAGLEPTLALEGPFTVFAPSDEAFAQLPEGTVDSLLAEPDMLAEVLNYYYYHVVPGRVTAADAAALAAAPTVQGEELRVSVDGSLHVDGAHVLSTDIEAANGIIHVIDRVLLPAAI
jgi:transforming growth factor-beta-induced protein